MKYRRWWFLLLLLAAPGVACADSFDLVAGSSMTTQQRTTPAVFASAFGASRTGRTLTLTPMATVGWLRGRHTSMDHLNHTVWLAGGGVRVEVGAWRHWFASEQLMATSTRTYALSSRLQFATSAGWHAGHFVIMLRHVSNGHLIGGGHNMGETMLLAGVRW